MGAFYFQTFSIMWVEDSLLFLKIIWGEYIKTFLQFRDIFLKNDKSRKLDGFAIQKINDSAAIFTRKVCNGSAKEKAVT